MTNDHGPPTTDHRPPANEERRPTTVFDWSVAGEHRRVWIKLRSVVLSLISLDYILILLVCQEAVGIAPVKCAGCRPIAGARGGAKVRGERGGSNSQFGWRPDVSVKRLAGRTVERRVVETFDKTSPCPFLSQCELLGVRSVDVAPWHSGGMSRSWPGTSLAPLRY